MARVYSVRLLGGGATDGLGATCPENVRWVVRDAQLYYDGASGADQYNLSVVGIGPIMYGTATADKAEIFEWQGRQVVNPGEELYFSSSTANWYVLVSGYALTLP